MPGGKQYLNPGAAYGDVDALIIQREMIRRTIKEHLDKELRLHPQGIKVLSLFFIDAVDRYRKYDENGNQIKGPYAHIFEEEYKRFANHPEYASLFHEISLQTAASETHDGYFSIDKHGGWTDTAENNQSNRDNAERAYNLIMKDKEKLLSFSTPLKFIFSHSALREGWDNPNIFQICSLRDIQTNRERRQTIGRGLRLCVNQHGDRVRGFEANTLTVIATENYEQFAENLQKEIEVETGIRFGIVEQYHFTTLTIMGPNGQATPMSPEQSKALWENLKHQGYIDPKGRVQDLLKKALKEGTLSVPEPFMAQLEQITQILRRQAGRLDIKNANERRQVRTRQAVLHSPEFKALWDRIKHKTIYRVQFDNEMLIANCIQALQDAPVILKTRLQWRKANLAIGKASVMTTESAGADTISLKETDIELPDLLTDLQDRTQLTRRSIRKILTESGRLDDFKSNPQQFIELAAEVINHRKRLALVDGIKYQRLGDKYYYAQELFEEKELTGYLKNMIPSKKSVYDHVVYDSEGVERPFAEELENHEAVKVYAKLPGWFKISTPLGTYNPDWAVLIEQDGTERVYFVVETKSSCIADERRKVENAKIDCAREHFSALKRERSAAEYLVATSLNDILHH
ncbi:MAG: hypothetical protein WAM28_08470 [Chlamydiales bacterium]